MNGWTRTSQRSRVTSSGSTQVLEMKFLVAGEGNLSGTDERSTKASMRTLFMYKKRIKE